MYLDLDGDKDHLLKHFVQEASILSTLAYSFFIWATLSVFIHVEPSIVLGLS